MVPGVVHFFTAGEESHIDYPAGGHDTATALTSSAALLEELTPASGRARLGRGRPSRFDRSLGALIRCGTSRDFSRFRHSHSDLAPVVIVE